MVPKRWLEKDQSGKPLSEDLRNLFKFRTSPMDRKVMSLSLRRASRRSIFTSGFWDFKASSVQRNIVRRKNTVTHIVSTRRTSGMPRASSVLPGPSFSGRRQCAWHECYIYRRSVWEVTSRWPSPTAWPAWEICEKKMRKKRRAKNRENLHSSTDRCGV